MTPNELAKTFGKAHKNKFGVFYLHTGTPPKSTSLRYWLSGHIGVTDWETMYWADYSFVILEGFMLHYELNEVDSLFNLYYKNRTKSRLENFELYQAIFEVSSDEYAAIQDMFNATRKEADDKPKTKEAEAKKK